ncbi:HalOD1 output domain-containing protein [Saliphagus sp. GCM10025334]|uniref:HalOD1 output domain-containing protein n=1 Tax=Natronosalvus caseinilyticus TaxID=2953747 RepID=UPI0028AC7775|nr:HalOD1 output domain-containing protein [Natronosalvus caseinilyticus]
MTQSLTNESNEIHEQIIDEVAALEDRDPLELPPLYDAVEPDALESIFSTTIGGTTRVGRVEFPYAGHTITVEFEEEPVVRIE